jgi:Tol biopolymer transport system component
MLGVLTAGFVATVALSRPGAPWRVRFADPLQVTYGTGAEGWASWSPDGRLLAYESDQTGNLDIWVVQLDASPGINRTRDHAGFDSAPSWSPDGNQIAFVSNRDGTPAVYVMPALTGPARKLAGPTFGKPQWSPSGTELAYLVAAPRRTEVEIVSLGTQATRRVTLEVGEMSAMDLSWSPDGRFFAYAVGAGTRSLVSQVWLLPLAGGPAVPITDGLNNDRWPTWAADARSLFLTSDRGGDTDLWQQRVAPDGRPADEPHPVTAGLGIRSAVLSSDGLRVAYTKGRRIANLWRVPILGDRRATWSDAEQLTFEQAFIESVDLAPDGRRLLIGSDRSGNHDVWLMSLPTGELTRVTTDPAADWGPRWSPDGRSLVFYSHRTGNRDVWTMPVEGGAARRVTTDPAQDMWPNWVPDGKTVSFFRTGGGTTATYLSAADGGEARKVIDDGEFAEWSPTTPLVSFFRRSGELWVASPEGAAARLLARNLNLVARWSPDGTAIFAGRAPDLLALDPASGRERPLTDLGGRRGSLGQFALATDGRALYFTWEEDVADLWVMSVIRENRWP